MSITPNTTPEWRVLRALSALIFLCLDGEMLRFRFPCVLLLVLTSLTAGRAEATPDGPKPPPEYLDRSGLSELVAMQAINGLVAGSFLSVAVTGKKMKEGCETEELYYDGDGVAQYRYSDSCEETSARAAGLVLLGMAAGVSLPYLLTRKEAVKTGDVILVNRATMIGAMHGLILPFVAGLDPDEADDMAPLYGTAFAGDLAGVAAGAYLANQMDLAPGTVSFLGTLHFATFLAAVSVGSSFPEDNDLNDQRVIMGVATLLADTALTLGIMNIDQIDIGRNRVFWLDTGGTVGWIAGAGLGAVIAGDEERTVAIGSAIGLAAGIALTYWATDDSEAWRKRRDFVGDLSKNKTGITFDAPAIRVEPSAKGDQHGTRYGLDLFRGTF